MPGGFQPSAFQASAFSTSGAAAGVWAQAITQWVQHDLQWIQMEEAAVVPPVEIPLVSSANFNLTGFIRPRPVNIGHGPPKIRTRLL